jgi:arylsulfatase
MSRFRAIWGALIALCTAITIASVPASAQQQQQRPNIIMIMGDDIGWFNVGVYNQGMMAGRTPKS